MTRLSININEETRDDLAELVTRRDSNFTEEIRRAVAVYEHLATAQDRGDRIRLTATDGSTQDVTIR